MRKNWLTTIGGIMAAMIGFPVALTMMGYKLPPWLSLTLVLLGMIGSAVTGVAAKGQDEHSTAAQVQLSSLQNPQVQAAAVVEAKAEAKIAPEGVPIDLPVPISVPKTPEVK